MSLDLGWEGLTKDPVWCLTAIEKVNMEPTWVYSRYSEYMLWLLAWCFPRTLTVEVGISLTLLPALGTVFLLLSYLVQYLYEEF